MTSDSEPPVLSAELMATTFAWDLTLAPSVVVFWDPSFLPRKARPRRRAEHPFRIVASLADGVDAVVATGPGSPVAAITAEFLAAFGVERSVAVGSAGLLHHDGPNHPVVADRAESDEATSIHYRGHLHPDPQLTQALINRVGGPPVTALTTDVPFRHTPKRLVAHRARAHVVEMECASFFAASHHVGLASGALLVPSDVFSQDGWHPLEPPSRTLKNRVVGQVVAALQDVESTLLDR